MDFGIHKRIKCCPRPLMILIFVFRYIGSGRVGEEGKGWATGCVAQMRSLVMA
jgi:hypothetical protein